MTDTLIKVEGVSKRFCRSLKKSLWYGLQDLGHELRGYRHGGNGELRADEFWALNDVSFEVKRGECLGLIGKNGAGKTTLLRMLNGLIKPDRGRIEMHGRVGGLIALGAGFNPILTGRENICVNASVLGLSRRDIDAKIDEIIDFSEIGEFIDMPVQSYSSGMNVRLGFAAASVLEPDILLLDEVLAVGDAAFRYKCYKRMDDLRSNSAVIFVSHDMPNVARICDRTLLMSRGAVAFAGSTPEGIDAYQRLNDELASTEAGLVTVYPPISRIDVTDLPLECHFNKPFSANLSIMSDLGLEQVSLALNVTNMSGNFVASCVVDSRDHAISIAPGRNTWRLEFTSLPLKPARYHLSFGISGPERNILALWTKGHILTIKGGRPGNVADCQLDLCSWATV